MDMDSLGAKKVGVFTDTNLVNLPPVKQVLDSLVKNKVNYVLYDKVRVEPTDQSFQDAAKFAINENIDAILAVGGGSVMDTAKAANLYSSDPEAEFLDYVNAPIGRVENGLLFNNFSKVYQVLLSIVPLKFEWFFCV